MKAGFRWLSKSERAEVIAEDLAIINNSLNLKPTLEYNGLEKIRPFYEGGFSVSETVKLTDLRKTVVEFYYQKLKQNEQ